MPLSRFRSLAPRIDQWLLGAAVAGALHLALQITHPLVERATAPGLLNWLGALTLVLGLFRFLARGKRDERWLALTGLFGILIYLGFCEPWSVGGAEELASRTARFLSTTHAGIPLIGLFCTWTALGVGLLCGRAALICLSTDGPWQRASAWLVGLLVATFGAHGVIGYASGNSSLLLP